MTRRDMANGYGTSKLWARGGLELLSGVATGGLSTLSKGGKAVQVAGRAAAALDLGGNVVGTGRGVIDVTQNGLSFANAAQISGGLLGIGGAAASRRAFLQNGMAVSVPRTAASADLPILTPRFQLDPTKVIGSENAYSTAFRTTLPPGKPRGFHFQQANRQLIRAMDVDPRFAQLIESLIPGVRGQLVKPRSFSRDPPTDWSWHHHADTGVLELVPRVQHEAGGRLYQLFHPNGEGGMKIWGR